VIFDFLSKIFDEILKYFLSLFVSDNKQVKIMSPGESEKIITAYKTERKKLLGYIRKRVPGSMEAEDILQDVFYQLTLGFRDLDRIQNLTAWLYKVTDNRITDNYRKKRPVSISYTETADEGEDGPLSAVSV